jgi:hypothetical protein
MGFHQFAFPNRISMPRERVVAAVAPYVLTASTWAAVGQAGGAAERTYDLATFASVWLRLTANRRVSMNALATLVLVRAGATAVAGVAIAADRIAIRPTNPNLVIG